MTEINQSGRLVRGPDGVLYRVFADGCDPVNESRVEQLMNGTDGVRRAVEDSSEHAASRHVIEPDDHVAGRFAIEPDDHAAGHSLSSRTITPRGGSLSSRTITPRGGST